MTKQQIKQQIADLKAGMENMGDDEKVLVQPALAKLEKQLAEADDTPAPKPNAKNEDPTPKPKIDPKKEKKPTSAIKDAELTKEDIAAVKKLFGALKEPMFQVLKEKAKGKAKKRTKVKPHSASYKHAKRIAENVPKTLRPALLEISKRDKAEKNKNLIPKVEKLSKVLTVLVNDIDLAVLTESEERVDAYLKFFIKMIKESHSNNAEFKYESRGRIKDIAKEIPELKTLQFADGGTV